MKIALVRTERVFQVALTAQSNEEIQLLKCMRPGDIFEVRRGSFYYCQVDWYREGGTDDSLILVHQQPAPPVAGGAEGRSGT